MKKVYLFNSDNFIIGFISTVDDHVLRPNEIEDTEGVIDVEVYSDGVYEYKVESGVIVPTSQAEKGTMASTEMARKQADEDDQEFKRKLFNLIFYMVNEIRVLKAETPLTAQDLKDFIKTL